jgi:hypothetical protein
MTRILIGGFLVAHGLVHLAVWTTPRPSGEAAAPFDPSNSWLIGSSKGLAMVLAIVAAVVLVTGGVSLFAEAEVWRSLTVVGLGLSLVLNVLYFNPWFGFISAVNAAFLAALVWAQWPSERLVGA